MYAGRIVEHGPVRTVFHSPEHPYTRGLLASMPGTTRGGRLRAIDGSVPVLGAFPTGCAFHPRCPDRFAPCDLTSPPEYDLGNGHGARCFLHDTSDAGARMPSAGGTGARGGNPAEAGPHVRTSGGDNPAEAGSHVRRPNGTIDRRVI
jgi:oligopeptide/dipeptide ABC transporter ATP-binding protein